jgi:hypothetical protein
MDDLRICFAHDYMLIRDIFMMLHLYRLLPSDSPRLHQGKAGSRHFDAKHIIQNPV